MMETYGAVIGWVYMWVLGCVVLFNIYLPEPTAACGKVITTSSDYFSRPHLVEIVVVEKNLHQFVRVDRWPPPCVEGNTSSLCRRRISTVNRRRRSSTTTDSCARAQKALRGRKIHTMELNRRARRRKTRRIRVRQRVVVLIDLDECPRRGEMGFTEQMTESTYLEPSLFV